MKKLFTTLLPLLLCLVLLFSLFPAALAEEEETLLDEARLDAWIKDFLTKNGVGGNQIFSVGFCYTATGDCWYYNGDAFMYSASMYKVPISMLLAEKEKSGLISQDTNLGGGTLKYLETTALIHSDNNSGHAMLDYLGEDNSGKGSKLCMQYASLDKSYFDQDFFDYSYYSARFITQVMETLYQGGEERFPHVIEYLLQAQPDSYLNLSLSGKYDVAQKYGAFKERNGNDNNHITAIVYTPTPIIVTVMTRNVGDYQKLMAQIGSYLADYSLELDEKLEARKAAQAEAAQAAQAAQAEAQAQAEEAANAPSSFAFTPGAQIEGGREKLMPMFYLLWAAILAFGALVAVHALKQRREKEPSAAAAPSAGGRSAPRSARHSAPTRGKH